MAGKIKHLLKREGRYYARVAVPERLRKKLGRTDLRKPLGADRRLAIKALPRAIADFQDQLAMAEAQVDGKVSRNTRPMSPLEMAHLHYEEQLRIDDELRKSGSVDFGLEEEALKQGEKAWLTLVDAKDRERASDTDKREFIAAAVEHARKVLGINHDAPTNPLAHPDYVSIMKSIASGKISDDELESRSDFLIGDFIKRGNTNVSPRTPEWRDILRTMALVQLESIDRMLERDSGNFTGEPALHILREKPPNIMEAEAVPISELYEDFVKFQNKPATPHRRHRYRSAIRSLIDFVGYDDAARLTKREIEDWSHDLIKRGRSAKTVNDANLAGLRSILAFGMSPEKRLLTENVALGVKVKPDDKVVSRPKGFTETEAKAILRAALNYDRKGKFADARRWMPWIMAFSGARVAEIAQLRKQDIYINAPVPYFLITPEAGNVKTNEYREVPLHRQLLEIGFDEFVSRCGARLFIDPATPDDKAIIAERADHVRYALGSWIKSLNVVEGKVSPNHGWRHRFITLSRSHNLYREVAFAITGHSLRGEGPAYGSIELDARAREIAKLPSISIESQ